jgi:type IV pilus assembly protein PilB
MSSLFDELIRERLISSEQLADAKTKQIGAKKPVHELLVDMGFLKEEDLLQTASRVYKMPLSDLGREVIDPEALHLLTHDIARRYGVFPVRREEDALVLAMSNPQDLMAMEQVRIRAKLKVKPTLCTKSDINKAINKYYQTDDSIYDILKNVPAVAPFEIIREEENGEVAIDQTSVKDEESPIVRLYNLIMRDALKARASDIHIEPEENQVKVRYRVDGDLRNIMEVPAKLQVELAARIKILAGMDVVEKRKPQDGRLKLLFQDRKIDLRIATIPTAHGEKVEIRVLDPRAMRVDLDNVGFDPKSLQKYKNHIAKPQGMVLVTGPTGSGKTTTLYATLNYIKCETKNIVTIEDPIEYLIEGINQTQINPAKDFLFSTALRSFLRQDPNVIFVGEIRDRETADIAFRASLTGHLVLSTLHTNSSVASITRLLDLGLEPYLIASSLTVVVAQRLIKKICPHCKEEYLPDSSELEKIRSYLDKTATPRFYRGKGCEECGFSGFYGRIPILEVLEISEAIKAMIERKASANEILTEARREGLKPLSTGAIEKVLEGHTTLDELVRVIALEEDEVSRMAVKRGERPRILIVDDEEDILRALEKRLVMANCDVIKARDGSEGLLLAFQEKPDLVITDVTMPKMNGFELTKQLRSSLETAVIPIIMLTARHDKESELKGIDSGADDYMIKPFDHDKLLARLKMLLRKSSF